MITALLILVFFVIFYMIKKELRPKNYPPGPGWWPYVGNGFMLRKLSISLNGQYLAFSHLAKQYGTSVLGLKLGKDLVVVGMSNDIVRAILTKEVFTGRPVSFFLNLRCFGKRQGITSVDGQLWREQRAFTIRHLKQSGFGKDTMQLMILKEVEDVVQFLGKEKVVENLGEIMSSSILNVLWTLATGKKLQRTASDERLKKFLKLLSQRSRAFDMVGGMLNQMPWLRFIAPKITGYSLIQELNSELKNFLMETINEEKADYNPEETRHIIDSFFHVQNSKDNKDTNFTDDQLTVLLLDLFLGGAQTTSQSLGFAFLLMIIYPEIQNKVYLNIVEKIGKDKFPSLEDKSKLVYVEAVLLEVIRMFCVVPVIGPRRCLEDTVLGNYYIPKNTTVLMSLYDIHHDESLFPEPFLFKPERFIDSEGNIVDREKILTFGLGKRRCLGEDLAKSFLFIMFAGIIQNFEITKPPNGDPPSLEILSGITIAPKPYSAQFFRRC